MQSQPQGSPNFHDVAESIKASTLRQQHRDLIQRLQSGDEDAADQVREMIEAQSRAVSKAFHDADWGLVDVATHPERAFLRLQRLRGEANDAATLVKVLLVEPQANRAPVDSVE